MEITARFRELRGSNDHKVTNNLECKLGAT